MADRPPQNVRLAPNRGPARTNLSHATSNGNSSSTTTSATTGNTGVRRNLFQSQLTRRPTPTSSTSAETLRLDIDVLSDTSELVIRDKNGDFELDDPPTPPFEDHDDPALDEAQENEQERRRLAEVVKHHHSNFGRMPSQPEEVVEALRASMRAQVASLAEDNWMYEAEEEPRVQ